LGEAGNISMGTSATTLNSILGRKVQITTPEVEIITWGALMKRFDRPCVAVKVGCRAGLQGGNILVLSERDVKIISSLMMGVYETTDINEPLSDIDLSAIGEAMNQMVGSSSTSLSSMMNVLIDIETPVVVKIDDSNEVFLRKMGFNPDEEVVSISFKMVVEGVLDSGIMQILPMDFAKDMVRILKIESEEASKEASKTETSDAAGPSIKTPGIKTPEIKTEVMPEVKSSVAEVNPESKKYMKTDSPETKKTEPKKTVSTVQFPTFEPTGFEGKKENIDIIMDVPLEVTVELGRTRKKIKVILEFTPGTVLELDKIAGEPIDVLVNGKYVAKGEVVVIDENFGIRITDIINFEHRM
jgi:flagellar motor switch protein FliN/FliY